MTTMRSVTGTVIAAAVLAASTTPAMAQQYPGSYSGGYGQRWGGEHRRHRDDTGAIIGGIAVIGVIAAIAAAASSSSRNRTYSSNDGYRGNINSEDLAADACASRIEQRYNGRVSNIDNVYRTRDGYQVRGSVQTRDSRDDRYGRNYDQGQSFTCSVRYGQVEDARVDGGYAYRGY